MKDKNLKTWLFIFVATLVVTSGGASFYAQKQGFYKGVEPQQWNFAKASALTVEENATVPNFFPAVTEAPTNEPPKTEAKVVAEKIVAEVEPVSSPCRGQEVPVIKNGQIQRCTGTKPAPKIKIIELQTPPLQAPLSCESQGRFTYTGEDQPGLLYGMCIDCLTTQFAANEGRCK